MLWRKPLEKYFQALACTQVSLWYSQVPVDTEKQPGHDLGGRFSKEWGMKKKKSQVISSIWSPHTFSVEVFHILF